MTEPQVALCADKESIQHPEELGLAGENLGAQAWLRLLSGADEARSRLQADKAVREVWVASCAEMAPINLAAAIKRDRPDRSVCMLSNQGSGSLLSRSSAAGIDASLTHQAFVERYTHWKNKEVRPAGAVSAGGPGLLTNPAPPSSAGAPAVLVPERQRPAEPYLPSVIGYAPPAAAAPQPAPVAAPRAGQGFLLPVVSGSGGAGKSTVAALCALISHALGYRTLLLDFDLQFGDEAVLLGVKNPLRVEDVLDAPSRLSQLHAEGRVPAVLAAPKRLEDAERVADRANDLLDRLLSSFEVVVANTGGSWGEQHAVLLERGSRPLFLVDQRSSSLRACQHALDLCARCSIATGSFVFAANRCAKGAPFTSIDVSCALRGAHAVELREGGREVEELLGAGQPLDLLDARNGLCESVDRVLREVLPGAADRKAAGSPASTEADMGFGRRSRKRRKGIR